MLVTYLNFVGLGLYLAAGVLYLYLFIKTLGKKDGNGLAFLKILTISLSIGSFVVAIIRYLSEYGELDLLTARAIAITNPVLLVAVALYLNYLIHLRKKK